MDFAGKVVVVTGASSGIGAAIAIKFAEQGAKVVLVGRNENRLKDVGERCEAYGTKPLMIIADVAKDKDIKRVITITMSQCERIDILINNAGILDHVAIYDEKAMEVYDRIMNTNLRSTVYLTNLAAPHLIRSKGNIINISSIAAFDPIRAENFAYCTSKAGMDHFTRCAALDFGPKGVRVNNVNPGPVRTAIFENSLTETELAEVWVSWEKKTTLGRVLESEEVGDLVLYLASDKAKGITGSSYIIDSGALLKRD